MCLEHASAIDDPQALAAYPAQLLRQWKADQIDDYRRRMEGWPLTTAMAEQVAAVSFSNVGIAIYQSTLHLGGGGGKALGAGGGGGGAIGPNSRAGRGGDGGDHREIDENALPSITSDEVLKQAVYELEQIPGAGGGGAGAIGPDAVAGGGGGGGDLASGHLALSTGDTLEVEIGDGGKGASLPGEHGQDGGDTVVSFRSADGTLKRTIRVKGGAGAKAGELPNGVTAITQADLVGGFQISTLLLVDALDFRDGVIFMLGGGWSSYNVPEFPLNAVWRAVCTATWNAIDTSKARALQLSLVDPQGVETSRVATELSPAALQGLNFHWWPAIAAPLHCEGRWTVRVESGQFLLSQIWVEVALAR
ncbi:MAG: glycine-rich domain-containing protein [Phenylobacterium sp.]